MGTEASGNDVDESGRTARRVAARIIAIVAVGAVIAVLLPMQARAWFWDDDDREIRVTGDLVCSGFDASLDSRFPYARVEGFEIRGRSGVIRNAGQGYLATYEVTVPAGWEVEWSIKCSNSSRWVEGHFGVNNTAFGSSYEQHRDICTYAGGLLDICQGHDFGGCVLTVLQGGPIPAAMNFEEALMLLFADNPVGNEQACLQWLIDHSPQLSATPAPTVPPTIATIPDLGIAAPLPTIGTVPPGTSDGHAPTAPLGTSGPAPTAPPGTSRPAPTAPPATPTIVFANPVSPHTVHVAWFDNSFDADAFIVIDANGEVARVGGTSTDVDVGGYTPGDMVCFAVRAENSRGSSGWSDWMCETMPDS